MAFEVYPMDIQRVGAPVRERPELPCTADAACIKKRWDITLLIGPEFKRHRHELSIAVSYQSHRALRRIHLSSYETRLVLHRLLLSARQQRHCLNRTS